MPKSIPGPRSLPLIGAAYTVDTDRLMDSQIDVVRKYGEICAQEFPDHPRMVLVRSQRLVDELCDERRFDKQVHPAVSNLRIAGGDGLFTADTSNPNWGKAHRILMPSFGPNALREMYEGMCDIAQQLILKWERLEPGTPIDVNNDFTRLTLDTIGLCAIGYRFNSFYTEDMHPLVQALIDVLEEAGNRSFKPGFVLKAMVKSKKRLESSRDRLFAIADRLIEDRRRNQDPDRTPDILDRMLEAEDPTTGEKLSDENVRYQLLTFLVAGHETTSGLLSFATYELMSNRRVLEKARREVDEALGGRFPRFEDLPKLGFVDRILRETLRLHPTAPAFALTPYEKTTIGDGDVPGSGWEVFPGDTLLVLTPELHRDPKVWTNPERFDPDRFNFEIAKDRAPNSWKPFGNGQRSCIGRGFALQEALLVLTLALQRFDFHFADDSYQLKVRQTLTLRPQDFEITVSPRTSAPTVSNLATTDRSPVAEETESTPAFAQCPIAETESHGTPMHVLYGSNGGTCEEFARQVAQRGKRAGFDAVVSPLDDYVETVAGDGPLIVVTSSYEGLPPDNARHFVDWVERDDNDYTVDGRPFAVFGCGNHEWARTFQRIPAIVDEWLGAHGGERLVERGVGDVRADYLGAFEAWADALFTELAERYNLSTQSVAAVQSASQLSVELLDDATPVESTGSDDPAFSYMRVLDSHELSNPKKSVERRKFHVTVELGENQTYNTGDYLEVLARNSGANVKRALSLVALPWSARISVTGHGVAGLNGEHVIGECLAGLCDLNAPASRQAISELAERAQCPPDVQLLTTLSDEDEYIAQVVDKRLSFLDLCDSLHAMPVRVEDLIRYLPPMLPRQYSISSSTMAHGDQADLTVSQVKGPAFSGLGTYRGVASTYISGLEAGDVLQARVSPGSQNCQLPEDTSTPLVLIAAGSGLALPRAFLSEYQVRSNSGENVAQSTLFYGCRAADVDLLYADELDELEQAGLLDLRPAFSQEPVELNGVEVRHVNDRLRADADTVLDALDSGAHFYVCGSLGVVSSVYNAMVDILSSRGDGEELLSALQSEGRYSVESFG